MTIVKIFDKATQIAIPTLTTGSQILISLKYPQWGLIVLILAQPFWLYSTWKSYKQADQIGIFVNTVIYTVITIFGIINYWIL